MPLKTKKHRKDARRLRIIRKNEKALRKAEKGKYPEALRGPDTTQEQIDEWRACVRRETDLLIGRVDGYKKVS